MQLRHAANMQQCLSHRAVQAFSTVTDGAVSLKTLVKDRTGQDVKECPRLHLYWLSVSASETTSHWASLITHYINSIQCVSQFPRPSPSQHPLIKQVQRSNGCAVRLLSDLQHMRGLETHSHIFSAHYMAEYGLSWERQSPSPSLALRMILVSNYLCWPQIVCSPSHCSHL